MKSFISWLYADILFAKLLQSLDVFGFIHNSLVANTDTILAISALVKKSPNLASLISLMVVISFSQAYK